MLIHWIWLAHRNGVSDRMKAELLRHFRDPEDIYFADGDAFDHVPSLTEEAKTALQNKDTREAGKILDDCAGKNIHILTFRDAAYPARLRNIPDPPVVLYYRGNLPDFDGTPLIGVVGTRHASAYGLGAAKRMGYQIASCGGIVVSGAAAGIDTAAMRGALTAGGPVVAVLGCGGDVVYPAGNRSLYLDVERFGCLLTEFPPGTPPMGRNFPRRNRIISGLSCGVLVVEAPEKSGALITAELAAEQGRDVFAVPGNIDVPSFQGSNRLIRDGAILASSGWDVLEEYQGIYPDKIHRAEVSATQAGYEDEVTPLPEPARKKPAMAAQTPKLPRARPQKVEDPEENPIDNSPSGPYSDVNKPGPKLNDTERTIVDALETEPKPVDEIIAGTGLETGRVLSTLTLLEIRGIVRRHPGKRFSLK